MKITPDPIVRTYISARTFGNWLGGWNPERAGLLSRRGTHLQRRQEGFHHHATNELGAYRLLLLVAAMSVLMIATGMPYWVGMNYGMMAGYTMPWTSAVGGLFGMTLGGAMMLITWVLAIATCERFH